MNLIDQNVILENMLDNSCMLNVCIKSHTGVSHTTGNSLGNKENSSVRDHYFKCRYKIQYKNFKIFAQSQNKHSLLFLESLFIKQLSPTPNTSTTYVPLKTAYLNFLFKLVTSIY